MKKTEKQIKELVALCDKRLKERLDMLRYCEADAMVADIRLNTYNEAAITWMACTIANSCNGNKTISATDLVINFPGQHIIRDKKKIIKEVANNLNVGVTKAFDITDATVMIAVMVPLCNNSQCFYMPSSKEAVDLVPEIRRVLSDVMWYVTQIIEEASATNEQEPNV